MRIIYSIFLYLGTPFILLHFAIRGLKDSGYLSGWKQRFAFAMPGSRPGGIVIHAASVGEVNAAAPLVNELLLENQSQLTLTTFTPTGHRRAKALFEGRVSLSFAPLDLPGTVKRFFRTLDPELLIIMETEIWPNLYHEAHKRNIPILMANARISEKSLNGYRRFAGLIRGALQNISHAATQSEKDAARLITSGADPDKVKVSGNLKFDSPIPTGLEQQAFEIRKVWGADRPVIIAASTHSDDDSTILRAFPDILKQFSDCLLIIVPRHPERFSATEQLARDYGLTTSQFSNGPACSPQTQCFVIDTMGELLTYYACSDLAIVGGSFGAVGGHNALEAAALSLPVLVGPDTSNFSEITASLIDTGAAIRVSDAEALTATLIDLLHNPEKRQTMGSAGFSLVENGKGALKHTLEMVEKLLTGSRS
jgi:3-deoxy-D-manno-octulosonic-acid transferase